MSEMVERVARAMVKSAGQRMFDDFDDPNAADDREWWYARARAAIAAMREPTDAMCEASNREWDGRMSYRSSGAWKAMIDAALKL